MIVNIEYEEHIVSGRLC